MSDTHRYHDQRQPIGPFKFLLVEDDAGLVSELKERIGEIVDEARIRHVRTRVEADQIMAREPGWFPLYGEAHVQEFAKIMLIGHRAESKSIMEQLAQIGGQLQVSSAERNELLRRQRVVGKRVKELQTIVNKSSFRLLRVEIIVGFIATGLVGLLVFGGELLKALFEAVAKK